ncbi:hypothetical protein EVA_15197, partial [gut metagenome]
LGFDVQEDFESHPKDKVQCRSWCS